MSEEYSIFDFVYPNQNDSFSSFNSSELKEFLDKLDKFLLEYRKSLLVDKKNSFGLELECNKVNQKITNENLSRLNLRGHWKTVIETTLDEGIEICSPILKDEPRTWEDLYKVCVYMDNKTNDCHKGAAHVHVGAHSLKSNEAIIRLLELYSTYENIIFRFGYGEDLKERAEISKFATPISSDFWINASTIRRFNLTYNEIVELLKSSKYRSLNFNNLAKHENIFKRGNTIEFRCANGTLNPIIWQNLVNLYLNIINSCNNLDLNVVYERHQKMERYAGMLDLYNEIFLDQALEFADLVFHNNADKVFFLVQYLKEFDIASEKNSKSKPLTRILTKSHYPL